MHAVIAVDVDFENHLVEVKDGNNRNFYGWFWFSGRLLKRLASSDTFELYLFIIISTV